MADGTAPSQPEQAPPQGEALKAPEGQQPPKLEISDIGEKTLDAYYAQNKTEADKKVQQDGRKIDRLAAVTV